MNKSAEKYQSIAAENKYFIEIRAYQRKLNTTKKKQKLSEKDHKVHVREKRIQF